MSDDLREQIARALWESRRSRLAGTDMHAARADADEILAVARPVIEQAEQERDDEASTAYIEQYDLAERLASSLVAAEARVATLEAALRRLDEAITDQDPIPEYHQRVMLRHRDEWPTLWDAIDAARAALGEQEGTDR